MKEEWKGYAFIAVVLMILWGVFGLIKGDGFIGGISSQIDAIGNIVSFCIKGILVIVVIWFLIQIFGDK